MFATEEARLLKHFRLNLLFNLAPGHQIEELALVHHPVTFVFFVSIENFLCRRQLGQMHIVNVRDLLEEVGQVLLF